MKKHGRTVAIIIIMLIISIALISTCGCEFVLDSINGTTPLDTIPSSDSLEVGTVIDSIKVDTTGH